jgi:hypothetical protein
VLEQRLVVALATVLVVLGGLAVAPFDWELDWLPRDPVAVDAIPDLGENQQIVFTEWPGRSPRDVEDQVTYPLTVQLMGLPGVREVRSTSMFGFSTISVIFDEAVEFYWSRSRIIEKLNSLPPGTLPAGVQPGLGPDATGLGQVYWYTLEGRDPQGPAGGGGTCTSSGPSRTTTSATDCWPPRGSARWRPSAGSSGSTRWTWTRTRCAPPAYRWRRSSARSRARTWTWAPGPRRSTGSST